MTALFSTAYLAPVQYYARLLAIGEAGGVAYEERHENFLKQTYRNRMVIAAASGPLTLSIPVAHTGGKVPICEVEVSTHGNWTHLHWQAIVSAYRQTPFFDYYADDIRPFFEHPPRFLVELNEGLRLTVCRLLGITTPLHPTQSFHERVPEDVEDCRTLISPRCPLSDDKRFQPAPYYQVFSSRHGFLPGLSICDLLFNMGPESRIVLRRSLQN
ncbi:MAG: WbqC family protein [Alloprevotella sp.]|nr:WbqC family protein [Alloprevotella sp.]